MTVESPLPTEPDAAAAQVADPRNHSAVSPEWRSGRPAIAPSRQAVAPITARRLDLGDPTRSTFEVVDRDGLVITIPLVGQHSSAAIARVLDLFARGDGLCLFHLTETLGGRCIDCVNGWNRHLLSAAPR